MDAVLIKEIYDQIIGNEYELETLEENMIKRVKKYLITLSKTNSDFSVNDIETYLLVFESNFYHIKKICNNRVLINFLSGNISVELSAKKEDSHDFINFIVENFENELFENFKKIFYKGKFYPLKLMFFERSFFSDSLRVKVVDFFINFIQLIEQELLTKKFETENQKISITNNNFFYFLSLLNDYDIEKSITDLYNPVVNVFNSSNSKSFYAKSLVAFSFYDFEDSSMKEIIEANSKIAKKHFTSNFYYKKHQAELSQKRSSSNFLLTFLLVILSIPVVIFLMVFFDVSSKKSSTFERVHSFNYLDKTPEFLNFLACKYCFDESSIFIYDTLNVKTGENPFNYKVPLGDNFFDANVKKVQFTNNSEFDLVVLSYLDAYDSNILSYMSSHFIKSKESFKINSTDSNLIHIFYVGNNLAYYQKIEDSYFTSPVIDQPRFINFSPSKNVIKYKFTINNPLEFYNDDEFVYFKSKDMEYYSSNKNDKKQTSHTKIRIKNY